MFFSVITVEKVLKGTSLAIQWLKISASMAGGTGLIPPQETDHMCSALQPKK